MIYTNSPHSQSDQGEVYYGIAKRQPTTGILITQSLIAQLKKIPDKTIANSKTILRFAKL